MSRLHRLATKESTGPDGLGGGSRVESAGQAGEAERSREQGVHKVAAPLPERPRGLRRAGVRADRLLLPGLLWLLLFLVIPMVLVLVLSFWQRDSYGTLIPAFTLDNYVRFFDSLYIGIFADTLVLGCITTLLCLLIGYPLAYYMTVVPPRWQKVLLILVMVPFWVNFLIRSYAWILILRSQGIVNSLLEALGWVNEPLPLLYTTGAVYVGMVYTLIPFMVLPIYAALEKRDRTLLEAAADLGATPAQSFWRITVPQTSAGTTAGCIIVFVSAMGMFVVPDVLGGAKSSMYSNIIQNQFLSARDWPFGAALSVLFIIFSLIMIVLYQRASRSAGERG